MAQQNINTGSSADSGTGDPLRTCFIKAEDNFTELYNSLAPLSPFTGSANITGSLILTGSLSMNGDDAILSTKVLSTNKIQTPISNAYIEFSENLIKFFVGSTPVEVLRIDGSTSPTTVVINNDYNNIDFRVRGSGGYGLSIDASQNSGDGAVGINTSGPQKHLDVNGSIRGINYYGTLTDGDPGEVGKFFITSSEYFGASAPYYDIICISQG
jgi:hypothetical protein